MGSAAAIRLGEEGVKVAALDIKECDDTVAAIVAAGGEAHAWQCDTTNEEQLAQTMREVVERFGGINILVKTRVSSRRGSTSWTGRRRTLSGSCT